MNNDSMTAAWRLRYRMTIGFALITIMYLSMIGRLLWLTTRSAPDLITKAEAQRETLVPLTPSQAEILDRNLIPLVSYSKQLFAAVAGEEGHQQLAEMLQKMRGATQANNPLYMFSYPPNIWVAQQEITDQQWAALRAAKIPGLFPVIKDQPSHVLAPHLLGGPSSGLIGYQDNDFRAIPARQSMAITHDSDGGPLPGLIHNNTLPADANPRELVTTLDAQIQSMVEQVMQRSMQRGAVVVMDPKSGDILAMASAPNYQPQQIEEILRDNPPTAPLLNRALSFYPPGSVYKLLVAGAALQEKAIASDERFFCPGYVDVGDVRIACTGEHGEQTLEQAIMNSCNAAFVQIGLKLGYSDWRAYSEKLGVGSQRHLPVMEDKEQLDFPFSEPIYDGDMANLSIGQGRLLVSPLDIAVLYSAIANGGAYHEPRLVLGRYGLNGTVIADDQPSKEHRLWDTEVNQRLMTALRVTVSSGTGKMADSSKVTIAGKSGTAETGRPGINHAWFAALAPVYDPQVVVAVFVEEGQGGGTVAGPIAREIIERILLEN